MLRKINRNIRTITRVKQSDRPTIIRSIDNLLREGVPLCIYKLDLASFYENIDTNALLQFISSDSAIPKQTTTLIHHFLNKSSQFGVSGLPRGIPISATLAEYAMRSFDQAVETLPECYYYSRFVDDIVLFTNGDEKQTTLMKTLRSHLSFNLDFNFKKCRAIHLSADTKSQNTPTQFVEFLGYKFILNGVSKNRKGQIERDVRIDIAESKVKKQKKRIANTFMDFNKNGDHNTLYDRIRLLTGNYSVYDFEKETKRKSGIYYSYPLIDSLNSEALRSLDKFYRGAILSGKHNQTRKLSMREKRFLLKYSFSRGHKSRIFYHFSQSRLPRLLGCWAYV